MNVAGRRDAGGVAVAAGVAAVAGYLVLWIAARVLSPAQNAEFLAFWGLLFFCFGTLAGLQSEVTRAVHAARTGRVTDDGGPRTAVLPVGLGIGLALALAVVATAPVWGEAALGLDPTPLVALVALGAVAFSGHATVAGTLAGAGSWGRHASLVAAESTTRLVLAAAVALGGSLVAPKIGLPAAAAVAAGTWLAASAVPAIRKVWGATVPGTVPAVARRIGHAMTGTAASAALVVGFPVLLRLTSAPEQYALAAPLLLALQLTRAPLMIPLGAFHGMVITHLLDRRGWRPLLRIAAALAGAGVLGAALAAALGPWLMVTLFGPDYAVPARTLATLAGAAALLALLTLTGAATLALGQHRGYAVGWLVATAVCAALLLAPLGLTPRTLLGLAVGPLAGTAAHAVWITRALRGARPSAR